MPNELDELLNKKYPTRQNMRDIINLQQEEIKKLSSEQIRLPVSLASSSPAASVLSEDNVYSILLEISQELRNHYTWQEFGLSVWRKCEKYYQRAADK